MVICGPERKRNRCRDVMERFRRHYLAVSLMAGGHAAQMLWAFLAIYVRAKCIWSGHVLDFGQSSWDDLQGKITGESIILAQEKLDVRDSASYLFALLLHIHLLT